MLKKTFLTTFILLITFILGIPFTLISNDPTQKVDNDKKQKIEAMSGILTCRKKSKDTFPSLKLGRNGFTIKFMNNSGTFHLPTGDNLEYKLIDGQVIISTVFRDEAGNILVRIVENEWFIEPSITFDRNYNESSLEVIDSKGEILFQVALDGATICLAGNFYSTDGRKMCYIPFLRAAGKKTLFRYPSKKYICELQ